VSRKQTNPAGSVYARKDGYWVAALSLAGRRVVRYGKTEREANQKLAELLRENYLGTLAAPTKTTLGQWVATWLEQQRPNVRESTFSTYGQVLTPLVERIGHLRLDRATAPILATTLAKMRTDGMGARRVQMAYSYARTCLKRAVDFGMIGSNPLDRVQKPRYQAEDRRYWAPDEARQFIAVALESHHQHAPLLLFLLGTRCRVGEGLGLRWSDVDLSTGVVHIHRALVWADDKTSVQSPKTRAGVRSITLPEFLIANLRSLPRPLDDATPVYRTEVGTTPTKTNIRRALQALCTRAGVPFVNVHGTRHLHAALLLSEGIDPQALRRRLGHAHVSMSIDRYAYAVKPDQALADVVSRALG